MGKNIAGIFSVPKYGSEDISNLHFCANDCVALKEIFNKHLGIEDENIFILGDNANGEVYRTDILKKVKYISRRADPDDTIFFYFSGHGYSENNIGYLATFDTDLDLASDTSIPISRIRDELNKSQAKRKMLIIDSCYSGIGTGKKIDPRMSEDFENSLFSDISEGWVVFASCKRNELSFPLEDNSMSVFTFYFTEGLKGNADTDADQKISLDDLNTYVTGKVSKWAIENGKLQTPNINMELAGTFTFTINNPETSDNFLLKPEFSDTERSAQSIVLSSSYEPSAWRQVYDQWNTPTQEFEEVSEEEREKEVIQNSEIFTRHLLAIMINYYKPSQIKINENDEYELPFGKLIDTSESPFKNEFKLILTRDLFSPTTINLLNSLDEQEVIKWNGMEYIFNGNFDFDILTEIVKEKEYSVVEYQLKQNYSCMKISIEKKEDKINSKKIEISFRNESQTANITIYQNYGLEKEFFQTVPITELIDIFKSSLKNT